MTTAPIKVRSPHFDFTDVEVVWGPNAEAVIGVDAGSPIITPIEIFLLKVMRQARELLDPESDAELLRDVDLFNRQEARHYKTHAAFNRIIVDWCPAVAGIVEAYEDDMNAFLAEKPLRWLLGYSDGFEAVGGFTCVSWVDGWMQELTGVSGFASSVADMFRWHLAEEYEHRTVVFRLFQRLFGEPQEEAHAFRVEMLQFALGHFGGYIEEVRQVMLATYREGMSSAELEASRAREAEVVSLLAERMGEQLQPAFSPSYDPADNPAPVHLDEVLDAYPAEDD